MSNDKPKGEKDHPQSEAEQRTKGKESTKRHVYVEPGVKIDFVQDLRDKYDSSQTEDATHSKKILFWTQVSAVLLFIYAGLTAWQGCLTRESINNNSRQFQIDQRPYVWALEYTPTKNVHIVANEAMWINIAWVNHGKSPAVKAMGTGKIFLGKNAMQEADKWFNSLGTGQLPSQPIAETIIPPGIPSDLEKPLGGYSTILTDHPLKQDEVDYILNNEEPVAMVLRMQYYDLFGNRYWSDLCLSRYRLGSYPHCTLHNEMH
jgi:hypothetical protein